MNMMMTNRKYREDRVISITVDQYLLSLTLSTVTMIRLITTAVINVLWHSR